MIWEHICMIFLESLRPDMNIIGIIFERSVSAQINTQKSHTHSFHDFAFTIIIRNNILFINVGSHDVLSYLRLHLFHRPATNDEVSQLSNDCLNSFETHFRITKLTVCCRQKTIHGWAKKFEIKDKTFINNEDSNGPQLDPLQAPAVGLAHWPTTVQSLFLDNHYANQPNVNLIIG